jgi:hypothetical protein
MTRDEFVRYCFEGEQWTKATIKAVELAQAGFLPVGSVQDFEREVERQDGMIEVRNTEPLHPIVFQRLNFGPELP